MSDTKELFPNPTVIVVRHGHTSFNSGPGGGRLKGTKYDLPLDSHGKREAREDARTLAGYDIAVVEGSDMKRSQETMREISKALHVRPEIDRAFHPWDVGYLSGQRRDVACDRIGYYIRNSHKPVPQGESYDDWFGKFSREFEHELKEAEGLKKDGKYQAMVVVTHSTGFKALEAILAGEKPEAHCGKLVGTGRMATVEKVKGKWHLNENPNL